MYTLIFLTNQKECNTTSPEIVKKFPVYSLTLNEHLSPIPKCCQQHTLAKFDGSMHCQNDLSNPTDECTENRTKASSLSRTSSDFHHNHNENLVTSGGD